MLEWVKSTVKDIRKQRKSKRRTKLRKEEKRALNEQKKTAAFLEAERARLMGMSEKELLVEALLKLRMWEDQYGRLKNRLEIMERNVEEISEGILDLEFGITCLGPEDTDA